MSDRTTELLNAIGEGDPGAAEELLPLVYNELRRIARARMAHERPGQTLQPTALVHEAYLRLIGDAEIEWNDRRHFYAAAARAMRRILIDRARRVASEKHGGALQRDSFADDLAAEQPRTENVLALDGALDVLERQDPTLAEIVKMRFYAG
ncbi:MAG: ECF-type sigma factor, partial [Acidobacteriota bacterium]